VGHLHPLVVSVAAVQVLGRLVHPHALCLQVVLRGVQPEVCLRTALALVPLRHAAVRGERAQDAWPEQRRPDYAEPVLLDAACLSIELPAVIALQVGDEGIREAGREAGSTRHPREASGSARARCELVSRAHVGRSSFRGVCSEIHQSAQLGRVAGQRAGSGPSQSVHSVGEAGLRFQLSVHVLDQGLPKGGHYRLVL
jgi:hypothetical protein